MSNLKTWLNTVATVVSEFTPTNGTGFVVVTTRGEYSLSIIRGAGTDESTFRISVALCTPNGIDTDTVCDADYPAVRKAYIKYELLACMDASGRTLTDKEQDFMQCTFASLCETGA